MIEIQKDGEQRMMIYSGVNIGIIRNCNFRCSMCTAVETHDKDKRMSMDKFEEILDVLDNKQNYRFSQKNMKFTGWGEPFMYGDSLFDMLSSAIKRGWKVKLTTNALLLTEENSRHLCEMGVSELDISLTGMTPEVFQKFQGNGFRYPDKILKQILLNIRRFIKIRESLGKGPKVYLSFLYCEESRKDLIPYLRVMKGGGRRCNYFRIK